MKLAELDFGSWLEASAWFDKGKPLQGLLFFQEQHFYRCTADFLTIEAGGDHGGVVEDEQVTGTEPVWQVAEMLMLVGCGLDDQEAGTVTGISRILSNPACWQIVLVGAELEIICAVGTAGIMVG
jgi:hypothetical protein